MTSEARNGDNLHCLVGFDIGDMCEIPDGRVGLVTGYQTDERLVYVTPWDETKEIKFNWDDITEHWKKPN